MAAPDASEIRRVLQVFDQSGSVGARQAVGMLQGICAQLAKDPAAHDLLRDPADAEAWRSAGGESFCDNVDFPSQLAQRWVEVLGRPDFANAGFDKDELRALKAALEGWVAAFAAAELDFGEPDELLDELDALIADAPEPTGDDTDSDDESDEDASSETESN